MIHSDNAIRFYLNSTDQEKWAIREFLRANLGKNDIADELLSIEDYVNNKRNKLLKLMETAIKPIQLLNQEYERFVKNPLPQAIETTALPSETEAEPMINQTKTPQIYEPYTPKIINNTCITRPMTDEEKERLGPPSAIKRTDARIPAISTKEQRKNRLRPPS